MKYTFFIACAMMLSCLGIAQRDYTTVEVDSGRYILTNLNEEDVEGKDSSDYVIELLKVIDHLQNQSGNRLYKTYVSDREVRDVKRALSDFTQDTTHRGYAKVRHLPFLVGDWTFTGDTIRSSVTIKVNGGVQGAAGKMIPEARNKFVFKDWETDVDLTFFKDPTAKRKTRYFAIKPDGTRIKGIKD